MRALAAPTDHRFPPNGLPALAQGLHGCYRPRAAVASDRSAPTERRRRGRGGGGIRGKPTAEKRRNYAENDGREDWIRTSGLLLPKQKIGLCWKSWNDADSVMNRSENHHNTALPLVRSITTTYLR